MKLTKLSDDLEVMRKIIWQLEVSLDDLKTFLTGVQRNLEKEKYEDETS